MICAIQFSADVFDRVEVSAWVVESVRNLVHALGKDSNAVDRQKWLAESSALLDEIRGASNKSVVLLKITSFLFYKKVWQRTVPHIFDNEGSGKC